MNTNTAPIIKDLYPDNHLDNFLNSYKLKEAANAKGMYCNIEDKWTNPLAKWIGDRKVLEVMSGAGHLAKALYDEKVNIKATDDYSWIDKRGWELVYDVEKLNAFEAIEKYGADVDILLISWPYMDSHAYDAIRVLNTINPNALIIYIGEDYGGCTANDSFFEHFEDIQNTEFDSISEKYESWIYIHDTLRLGVYKP